MVKEKLQKIAVAESDENYCVFQYYTGSNKWFESSFCKDKSRLEGYVSGLVEGSGNPYLPIENGIPLGFKALYATRSLEMEDFKNILFYARHGDV